MQLSTKKRYQGVGDYGYILKCKKEQTMDLESISVNKRGAPDVVFVSYLGEDEDDEKKLDSATKNLEK